MTEIINSIEYPSFNNANDVYVDESEVVNLKCGEIVFANLNRVYFTCSFCSHDFKVYTVFLEHIFKSHVRKDKTPNPALEAKTKVQRSTAASVSTSMQVAPSEREYKRFGIEDRWEEETPQAKMERWATTRPANQYRRSNSQERTMYSRKRASTVKSEKEDADVDFEYVSMNIDNNKDPWELEEDDVPDSSANSLSEWVQINKDYGESEEDASSMEDNTPYMLEMDKVKLEPLDEEEDEYEAEQTEPEIKREKREPPTVPLQYFGRRVSPNDCKFCQASFNKLADVKAHMRKVHPDEKWYDCSYCDVIFKDQSNLKVHVNRHLGVKQHKCEHCNKCFVSSTELKLHSRSHTGEKPYQCERCKQNFTSASHLRAHERRHLKLRKYCCEVCGKAFYDGRQLRGHMVTHSNERPFKCDTCGSAFSRKKALVEHSYIHDRVKKFVCYVCGRGFAQYPGLWAHQKIHERQDSKEQYKRHK